MEELDKQHKLCYHYYMSSYFHNKLPKIDTSFLPEEVREIADMIHVNGVLRASKPKATKKMTDKMKIGKASYMWRMVAFQISPYSAHHCMPVTADWDIPSNYDDRLAITKELDIYVDMIVNSVPKSEWHGIRRWSGLI